jgi:hypothetical protein
MERHFIADTPYFRTPYNTVKCPMVLEYMFRLRIIHRHYKRTFHNSVKCVCENSLCVYNVMMFQNESRNKNATLQELCITNLPLDSSRKSFYISKTYSLFRIYLKKLVRRADIVSHISMTYC